MKAGWINWRFSTYSKEKRSGLFFVIRHHANLADGQRYILKVLVYYAVRVTSRGNGRKSFNMMGDRNSFSKHRHNYSDTWEHFGELRSIWHRRKRPNDIRELKDKFGGQAMFENKCSNKWALPNPKGSQCKLY